jgi:polysaccharide biosynthesis transport protein
MMDSLLQRKSDLRVHLDAMLPANPLYKAGEKELTSIDNQLHSVPSEMVHTIGAQLMDKRHTDVEQARRIEAALGDEITQRVAAMEKASREVREARGLNEDIERSLAHLRDVQQRIDGLKLEAEMPGFLRVFSVAQQPLQPLKNEEQKATGTLLVLALALSFLFPVTLDIMDPRIYSPASIERVLGFLPVGMTIEGKQGKEEFAEEHLRRVVSGIQRSVARGAKTVLLAPLKFGLPDTLADEIAKVLTERGFRPVLIHANRQNLFDRVAGGAQTTALGPYGSLLKAEVQDCDVVLVSTPPLLLSSDAELLATEADVTLMIVQAGKTTRKDLERAGRLLERLRVGGVGVILSGVQVERGGRLIRRDFRDYTTAVSSGTLPANART